MRIYEIVVGASSSPPTDAADLSSSTSPPLEVPLSTPITIVDTINERIPAPAGTITDEMGLIPRPPMITLYTEPSETRYVYAPTFYILRTLGQGIYFLLGMGVYLLNTLDCC